MSKNGNAQSKYQSVAATIKKRVLAGELCAGEQIPTLDALCEAYGVSLITARRAIEMLEREGLLYRVQGKGTFVAESRKDPRTLALVVPHLYQDEDSLYDHSYLAPLINAVERAARAQNANILLYLDNEDRAVERENLYNILNRQLDGAIVFPLDDVVNMDILQQLSMQIPVVLIDRCPAEWSGSYVVTDNYTGARQLTSQLLASGFSTIYYIGIDENVSSVRERFAGYLSAMHANGCANDALVHRIPIQSSSRQTMTAACALTKQLLQTAPHPCAFFALNNDIFAGIWRALQETGVDPREIGLACFDRPSAGLSTDGLLLYAEQPADSIGGKSVQVVMDQVHGIHDPRRITLEPKVAQ
ncbi:MAG TPA: GntR family transcriptional regulator, partial [Armatimonadota bacterium]|nr:GntR family transcriptional regulator [Armatimonadota bacterium]